MGVAIQYRMRRRLLRRLYFDLGEKLMRDALSYRQRAGER